MNWERFIIVLAVLMLLGFGVIEDPNMKYPIIVSVLMGYGFRSTRPEK